MIFQLQQKAAQQKQQAAQQKQQEEAKQKQNEEAKQNQYEESKQTNQQSSKQSQQQTDKEDFDKEVFKYHNQMRTNPKSFIPILKEMLTRFNGNIYKKPGEINLLTNEGPSAVHECINFLEKTEAVPELEWQEGMRSAARDHVNDTGPNGIVGHQGTDGSSMRQRIERYVKVEGCAGENIDYGSKQPIEVIIALAVDDGVANRGHRNNIFSKGFKKMGCYTGYHKAYRNQTVIDYNGSQSQSNPFMQGGNNFESFRNNFMNQGGQSSGSQQKSYMQGGNNFGAFKKNFMQQRADFGGFNNQFTKQGDNFENTPENAIGCSTQTRSKVDQASGKMIKETIKTYTFADGSTKKNVTTEYMDV